jgi:hypothetical protein
MGRADGRLLSLPIDYEKEYKEAKSKLQFHRERVCYHTSMESYYSEQLEELEPLTDVRDKAIAKAKDELENSKEFQEIRKKVKRKAADLLVDRMLQEMAKAGV